ncbi:hypothetical protein [Nonomuraea jiangxiensis]|nr:hypothetical protein [Nonomuraea jiangxiensis]
MTVPRTPTAHRGTRTVEMPGGERALFPADTRAAALRRTNEPAEA